MATAKPARAVPGRSGLRRAGLILGLLILALLVGFGPRIGRYATAAAAVGAREACSCRFVAGRELGDCRKDFEPGMGMVMLSEDVEAKSVTARVPLLSRQTATYREGEGCLLERWSD